MFERHWNGCDCRLPSFTEFFFSFLGFVAGGHSSSDPSLAALQAHMQSVLRAAASRAAPAPTPAPASLGVGPANGVASCHKVSPQAGSSVWAPLIVC